jgi:hypothetical protein
MHPALVSQIDGAVGGVGIAAKNTGCDPWNQDQVAIFVGDTPSRRSSHSARQRENRAFGVLLACSTSAESNSLAVTGVRMQVRRLLARMQRSHQAIAVAATHGGTVQHRAQGSRLWSRARKCRRYGQALPRLRDDARLPRTRRDRSHNPSDGNGESPRFNRAGTWSGPPAAVVLLRNEIIDSFDVLVSQGVGYALCR